MINLLFINEIRIYILRISSHHEINLCVPQKLYCVIYNNDFMCMPSIKILLFNVPNGEIFQFFLSFTIIYESYDY